MSIRFLLPVVATLLISGCACNYLVCVPDIGGDPVTSGQIAADLWEVERNRMRETLTGEDTPDTTEVPDSLDVISPARVMRIRR